MPEHCRVEYLRPDGEWSTGHHGVNLVDPERYVASLARRGTVARVSVLDDRLRPTTEFTAPLPPPCDLCGRYLHKIESECLL